MSIRKTTEKRAIIFDLGRVLIHYDHQVTLSGLAGISQKHVTEVDALNDPDIDEKMGRGELNARDIHKVFVEHVGTVDNFDSFVDGYAAGIQRNEDALAYATSLCKRPNLKVGIISNTNEAHALWLYANLPELKSFDHVILSNEVGLIKPDGRIYQMALDALDMHPSKTMFVDDLAENVAGAQELGMAGIVHSDWSISRPIIESWVAQQ